jgi:hypothetical protein
LRYRRKRKIGEREQPECGINNIRHCFHVLIPFVVVFFFLRRPTQTPYKSLTDC